MKKGPRTISLQKKAFIQSDSLRQLANGLTAHWTELFRFETSQDKDIIQ